MAAQQRHYWTPAEDSVLEKMYAEYSTKWIARGLGLTIRQVYVRARKLGLSKSDTYIQNPANGCRLFRGTVVGKENRFPKGHVPVNAGTRRPGWSPGRMKETQFRKGERSGAAAKNWVPIGTVAQDPEGYLRIKVREAEYGVEATGFGNTKVWPLLARHLWEVTNGPIPEKHLVVYKDGDRRNCTIENLELMSMADNARRNVMWARLPRELSESIQALGMLKRKIRRSDAEKQDV